MVFTNEDYERMLSRILEWSETKCTFDATTFEGIQDNYQEYGDFTMGQESAIENVYNNWRIEKWYNKTYPDIN